MGILDFDDHYKAPFTPKRAHPERVRDNFEELQLLGRKPMSEDYSDSPFADRKEKPEDDATL